MSEDPKKVGRRDFIGTAAAAAGFMIIKPQHVRGTAINSSLRVGLLGCGGRGKGVATALSRHPKACYVGLGDLFSDQLDKAKQQFDSINAAKGHPAIDPKLMFRGPKAYQAMAESNQFDVIHIATPDFFHPKHLEAVIAAGKHCYCEKPTGVDVRSAKKIMELGKKAEGRMSLDIGFQIRYAPPYVEMVKRHPRRGHREDCSSLGLLPRHDAYLSARPAGHDASSSCGAQLLLGPSPFRRHHRGPESARDRHLQLGAQESSAQGRRRGWAQGARRLGQHLGPLRRYLHLPG